jgi:hypothetical protein
MTGEASTLTSAPTSDLERLEELRARIAELEAKLAQADRIIVNALDCSVSLEDICKKLRSAHAMLKEAHRNDRTYARNIIEHPRAEGPRPDALLNPYRWDASHSAKTAPSRD